MFVHQKTNETWSMHISIDSGEAKAYYFNADANESRWEPPGSLSGLSIDALSELFAETCTKNDSATKLPSAGENSNTLYLLPAPIDATETTKPKPKRKGVSFSTPDNSELVNDTAILGNVKNNDDSTLKSTQYCEVSVSENKEMDLNIDESQNNTQNGDIDDSLEVTLVSALKDSNAPKKKKKKKKRAGGIRFSDDPENSEVKTEVKIIDNEPETKQIIEVVDADSKANCGVIEDGGQSETDTEEVKNTVSVPTGDMTVSADISDDKTEINVSGADTGDSVDQTEGDLDDKAEIKTETELIPINELCIPPVQPLPPKERKMFSFTKTTSLGVTVVDGLLPTEVTNEASSKTTDVASIVVESKKQLSDPFQKNEYPVLVSGNHDFLCFAIF